MLTFFDSVSLVILERLNWSLKGCQNVYRNKEDASHQCREGYTVFAKPCYCRVHSTSWTTTMQSFIQFKNLCMNRATFYDLFLVGIEDSHTYLPLMVEVFQHRSNITRSFGNFSQAAATRFLSIILSSNKG